jgi:hypothetical protein
MKTFPVGGPRDPVYTLLRENGWRMSSWSDKFWNRHDGAELHLYGAGPKAKIAKDGAIVFDGPLSEIDGVHS